MRRSAASSAAAVLLVLVAAPLRAAPREDAHFVVEKDGAPIGSARLRAARQGPGWRLEREERVRLARREQVIEAATRLVVITDRAARGRNWHYERREGDAPPLVVRGVRSPGGWDATVECGAGRERLRLGDGEPFALLALWPLVGRAPAIRALVLEEYGVVAPAAVERDGPRRTVRMALAEALLGAPGPASAAAGPASAPAGRAVVHPVLGPGALGWIESATFDERGRLLAARSLTTGAALRRATAEEARTAAGLALEWVDARALRPPVPPPLPRRGETPPPWRARLRLGGAWRPVVLDQPLPGAATATGPSLLDPDDPAMAAAAALAAGDGTPSARAARLAAKVHRELVPSLATGRRPAPEVLRAPAGDCTAAALLTGALARAAGIPSRQVTGLVWSAGALRPHRWVEIWDRGWRAIDPTLGEAPARAPRLALAAHGADLAGLLLEELVLSAVRGGQVEFEMPPAPSKAKAPPKRP